MASATKSIARISCSRLRAAHLRAVTTAQAKAPTVPANTKNQNSAFIA
jgi:hypothetical protein